jgi:hypothetical protein
VRGDFEVEQTCVYGRSRQQGFSGTPRQTQLPLRARTGLNVAGREGMTNGASENECMRYL